MSLVCTVTSTPAPAVSWWYRGLFINNGSAMVSDIGECPAPVMILNSSNFEIKCFRSLGLFHFNSNKGHHYWELLMFL